MNDLISIIVPVYNVEQYLSRCVDSVINQSYKNLEIILVDDGSTDSSGKICDEYVLKDNRIKVIHKENGGVSSARNVGLDIAKGDYIGFVDSDDFIAPDMYEYLYSLNKKNNTSIAVCNFYFVKNKKIIAKHAITENSILSTERMLECSFKQLFSWNKLFAKFLFEQLYFPEDTGYGEDMAVCMNLFIKAGRISYGKEPKYYYRQQIHSATHIQKWSKNFLGFFKSTDAILEYAKKNNLNSFKNMIMCSQMNKVASFLKICLITESIDYKSVEFLQARVKNDIKCFLISKIKITKKIFVLFSFINLNLTSKIYKLLFKLKAIK